MGYRELREQQKSDAANHDLFDFTDHIERIPNLHSGFLEPCEKRPEWSAFKLTIYFQNGRYKCMLLDRQGNEKAFCDVGRLLDAFDIIEAKLADFSLEWQPMNGTEKW